MTIKLNWWYGLGLFTLLFSVFALFGWIVRAQTIEEVVQEVDRIRIVEKIVTQNITEYVDRIEIKEVPYPVRVEVPYELSSNTISLNEVLAILTMAKAPHAYMVLHPELQNASTGNTTFNLEWMDNYDKVDNFIKWQTNHIRDLGKENK